MKLRLFVSLVSATVLAAAPAFSQPDTQEVKPRDTSAVDFPFGLPQTQVRDFFRILVEGRVDAAYDQLLKGTKIAEMPKDVTNLKLKTREAMKALGDISGYDPVDEKTVGSHLTRITCLSLAKNLPIRWRFYFYKVSDTWKLIDIRIDDRLVDLFEEPTPLVSVPAK